MGQKDICWFALATSVDYLALGVLLALAYKRSNGPPLRFCLSTGKYLLKKSYHYILSGMMVAIYGQTDRLMLKQMLDESSVGYYTIATTVCSMWTFVLNAIIDSVYPTIMRLHNENYAAYEKKNRQLYAIVFYVTILASVFFLIAGKWIVNILYGKAYSQAVLPLKIVTWYTAFSYLGVARNAWIVCENKQKYLKYIYLAAVVINIILNTWMIPLWGPSGAALASLVTQISTSILLPLLIKPLRPNAKMMLQAIIGKGLK
jgi:O-antigen/teichoic acid export membrane protein